MSIMVSQSLQFMSGFEKSAADHEEDLANFFLKLYKKFANTEQVVSIIGKDKINEIKKWSSEDIQLVNSVYVERVDPVSQTIAGRLQMAQDLMANKMISNPQEYLTVLTTGQLEPMYKAEVDELKLVHSENQRLMEGVPAPVLITDNHPMHISEHLCVLSDPDLRIRAQQPGSKEEAIVGNALNHIQQHKNFMQPPMAMGPPGLPMPSPSPVGQPPNSGQAGPPPDMNMPPPQ